MIQNPYQASNEPSQQDDSPRDDGLAVVTSFSVGMLWFGVDVALIFLLLTIDPGLIVDPLGMLFLVFGMPALMIAIVVAIRSKSASSSWFGYFLILAFSIALGFANAWFILQFAAAC